jgi:hypothetical protein
MQVKVQDILGCPNRFSVVSVGNRVLKDGFHLYETFLVRWHLTQDENLSGFQSDLGGRPMVIVRVVETPNSSLRTLPPAMRDR